MKECYSIWKKQADEWIKMVDDGIIAYEEFALKVDISSEKALLNKQVNNNDSK